MLQQNKHITKPSQIGVTYQFKARCLHLHKNIKPVREL